MFKTLIYGGCAVVALLGFAISLAILKKYAKKRVGVEINNPFELPLFDFGVFAKIILLAVSQFSFSGFDGIWTNLAASLLGSLLLSDILVVVYVWCKPIRRARIINIVCDYNSSSPSEESGDRNTDLLLK